MKLLAIITALLVCIILLLCIRIRICLDFSSKLSISLRVLFIRVRLYPKKRSPKSVIKAQKKQARRAEKKRKKAAKKAKDHHMLSSASPPRKTSPRAVLRLAMHLLHAVSRRFPHCFRLYLRRAVICVGGSDAAEVALRYGGIRAALSWFCTLLDKMFTVRTSRRSELRIDPDFTGGDDAIDLSIILSARVGSLLALLIRVGIAYLRRPHDPRSHPTKKQSAHSTERSTANG